MSLVAEPHYINGGPHANRDTVIIFIHGYTESSKAWGDLPNRIATDPQIESFADVFMFDYPRRRQVPQIAQVDLESQVHRRTIGDGKRNIVFVCHSLGGVIAWQTIWYMQGDQTTSRPFKMVFTYGTPYKGSDVLVEYLRPWVDSQILAAEVAERNPYLTALLDKWKSSSWMKGIDAYCAYEGKKLPVKEFGSLINVQVVSEDSATAICNQPHIKIDADHNQMIQVPDAFIQLKRALLESETKWAPVSTK
ncbi:MAG TPA: alpha/beta fold hydrolase [Terriglobales bacterium]